VGVTLYRIYIGGKGVYPPLADDDFTGEAVAVVKFVGVPEKGSFNQHGVAPLHGMSRGGGEGGIWCQIIAIA
jgi:hypothetical protein